jgi:hypothetical protein
VCVFVWCRGRLVFWLPTRASVTEEDVVLTLQGIERTVRDIHVVLTLIPSLMPLPSSSWNTFLLLLTNFFYFDQLIHIYLIIFTSRVTLLFSLKTFLG